MDQWREREISIIYIHTYNIKLHKKQYKMRKEKKRVKNKRNTTALGEKEEEANIKKENRCQRVFRKCM